MAGAVLLALLLLSLPGVAAAADAAEFAGPPQRETELPEEKSFTEKMTVFGESVSKGHEQLEQDILEKMMRLDDFLGGVQTEGERQTSYVFRLRGGLRFEEGGGVEPDIALRASLVLPKTSKKLRLVISGENQNESPSPALPQDPGNPGFDRIGQPTSRVVNTEFRYELLKESDQYLFMGAGVKVALPMVPFVRGRYQYTRHFSRIALFRLGETLFAKEGKGVGETTEITLERLLTQKNLLRLANSATLAEEFKGLEWGSELSFIRQLTPKSAITFTGGIYGNTDLAAVINNYRLLSRYRRNFFEEWLFFEVEPEITWPRNDSGAHVAKLALTFRLEVLFSKVAESR